MKQGDGAADVKPIAHLYKSQVYALAEYLGVPEEIRRRPPTTDTFSLPQTQEEFYYRAPLRQDGPVPVRAQPRRAAGRGRAGGRPHARSGRARLPGHRSEATHDQVPARAAASRRTRRRDHHLMCGIAGIVSLRDDLPPPELDQLGRMAGALEHRGPDEFGLYRDRRAGLAPRAALDHRSRERPAAAHQRDRHALDRLQRRDLQLRRVARRARALGHRFKTRSDTEVIVHAFEQWGEEAFRRFNGQWAVALWDSARVAAGAGARPLWRAAALRRRPWQAGSTSRARSRPSSPPGPSPAPARSARASISSSRSGRRSRRRRCSRASKSSSRARRASTTPASVRRSRCYDPSFPTDDRTGFRGTLDDAVAAVRAALEQATSLRMLRADVPVGSYLSGGLDSSLVAALGLRAKGSKFPTFSLRFEDAEYDETITSARWPPTSAAITTRSWSRATTSLESFPRSSVTPNGRCSEPRRRRCSCCRGSSANPGIKVVLTGEGADEMFAGYDLFREAKVRRFWARQPQSEARPRLLETALPIS